MEYFIFGIVVMCFIVVMTLQHINKERLIQEKGSLQGQLMGYKDAYQTEWDYRENLHDTINDLRFELQKANNKIAEQKMRTVVIRAQEVFTLFELTALKEDPEQFIKKQVREKLIEEVLKNDVAIELRTTKEDLSMHIVAEARMQIIKPNNNERRNQNTTIKD